MRRRRGTARSDWRERIERLGFAYAGPCWDESVCYELTRADVNTLEAAAASLHYLCLEAVETIIARGWWERLGIPAVAVPSVLRSWNRREFSLYGRFDLAFDATGPPKLLEYNVDTPSTLIEAAVGQWFWLAECHPGADQFNRIHDSLLEAWRPWAGQTVYFSPIRDDPEGEQTGLYLMDTACQARVKVRWIYLEDIGWSTRQSCFVDLEGARIDRCFKLYPWEWLWRERFGAHLPADVIQLVEPAWKMLLGNKALLPVLWELFPNHPLLLPTYDSAAPLGPSAVRKPKLGRGGNNITWTQNGRLLESTGGPYGAEGFIWQAPARLGNFDGQHPVFGLWMVGAEPAGLGIREDASRITAELSRFVPHLLT